MRFHEAEPQLVEHHLEQLTLFCGEVAARLFFEEREDVDHLARGLQIDRPGLGLSGLEAIAEMHGSGRREREDEGREVDVRIRHKRVPPKPECYHEQMSETGRAFEKLVDVMRTLRSPEGCPWDREQTLESLTHYVLEEAHEVVDAIERGDMDALREEIGDHIFEGVFLAQVATDRGLFTVDDSLRTVVEKLVRRHPHVFQEDGRVHDSHSKERAPSAEAALDRWNSLKARERAGTGTRHTTLGSVPKSLPSLLRAYKIGKRAASVGFDWATTTDVVAKIEEEVAELRDTLDKEPANAARAEEEMGDLLFAIANLSRKLGIEPEAALRKANEKFTKRFNQLEDNFEREGRPLEGSTLEDMEAEWQRIKNRET